MAWHASNNYSRSFWLFLIIVTGIRIIIALTLDPAPQETYYWNYSKHLALSYFDHPPMTAYLIYFFTGIFGDTRFGLHAPALFVTFCLAVLIFYLIRGVFDEKTAFWSVIVGSTTFIFALGGLIITPDGPLLFFWFLAMLSLLKAIESGKRGWWILSGLFGGAAFLSKYTAVFIFLGAFLYLLSTAQARRYLLSFKPYGALVISVIVALPVIVWNYQHGWASFVFQSEQRAARAINFRLDYLFGFLGSQLGILAIFLMPLFIWGIIKLTVMLKEDHRLGLFFWFAVPYLVFFVLVSPFSYVKMNWLAPAYLSTLPAIIFLYFRLAGRYLRIYARFALTFSIAVTLIFHLMLLFPIIGIGRADSIHGWADLARRVDRIRRDFSDQGRYFICGYEYKTASELRFHLEGKPETVSNNIIGQQGLEYDYWCDPDTLVGLNCLFIYDARNRPDGPRQLSDFFEHIEGPEILSAFYAGRKITDFYIFKCYNYRGAK